MPTRSCRSSSTSASGWLAASGRAELRGRVVTLKIKYADFEQLTRRSTLPRPTDDAGEIYRSVREDLARAGLDRPVRLTGVTVSGFDGVTRRRPSSASSEGLPASPRRTGRGSARRSTRRSTRWPIASARER